MKRCSSCQRDLPLDDFGVAKYRPDGTRTYKGQCRPCIRARRIVAEHRRNASAHPVDAETELRLPVAPLRRWINEQFQDGHTMTTLAEKLGVPDRTVRAWLYERDLARLDAVDAAFCRAGDPGLLRELWPEIFEFADAAA